MRQTTEEPRNHDSHPYQYPPTQHRSARELYPTFLSVPETLKLQATWIGHGLYDSFRWNVVLSTILGDAEVRTNMYKSLLLNSLSLTSIFTFDFLISPLVQNQQKWLHRNVGWFYQVLWLLPIVGVSFYLNSTWCSVIAKRTYTLQHGTRATPQTVTYTGMLTAIATSAYRVVMVFTSVVVSFVLQNIPYIGPVLGFVFLCWIDAYYCFEFVWIARGMSLPRRIRHLEERWAYYFAFGLPSAALCTFGTGLANAAIFALVFPAYIILAMNARPVPIDPYNPLPPVVASHAGGNDTTIRHPSPFVPIRIPVFALVMWLNDVIVKVISVGTAGARPQKNPVHQHRPRTLSDSADSVEEGEGEGGGGGGIAGVVDGTRDSAQSSGNSSGSKRTPKPALRAPTGRINLGRRKLD